MAHELRFSKNGKFKILVLSDLHEKESVESPSEKAKFQDMLDLVTSAVQTLKPDLAVYNGDNFSASDPDRYREVFLRCTEPIRNQNIPIAYVNGNHDHELNVDIHEILSVFSEYEYCAAYNGTPEISSSVNYVLPIKGSRDDTVKFNLWMMDSNNLARQQELSEYDWVHNDQIEWYEKTALLYKERNSGNPVPAIVFQHIPVPEIYQLLKKAKKWELPYSVAGHGIWQNKRYVLKPGVSGYLGQGPCAPEYNNGQFASWKRTGDVIGAIFGHDHMNDFSGSVDGILLAQCKTASFRVFTDGCRSGVRLITIDEEHPDEFTTEMFHFKDFGLKSKSLGPLKSRLTDRQSQHVTIAGNIVAAGAAAVGIAAGVISMIKKKK